MKIFHDPRCLLHDTVELLGAKLQRALESPDRLRAILAALDGSKHDVEHLIESKDAETQLEIYLADTHDKGYLEHLRTTHPRWHAEGLIEAKDSVLPECFPMPATSIGDKVNKAPKDIFAQAGFYAFDMSTGLMKDSWTAIRASAALAMTAAHYVFQHKKVGSDRDATNLNALALCRPPGHHCTTAKAGGYCYVNNAVVAVRAFEEEHRKLGFGRPRITILDLDVHHGNGTQDVFYTDPSVLYVSIHARDEYPYYSGAEDEQGSGQGVGFNLNLPLAVNSSLEEYLAKVDLAVARMSEHNADYMVVSLGFDTFMLDPLGRFQIDTGDYETIARRLRGTEALQDIPTAILLEGGYVVDRLGANLLSFMRGWEQNES